MKILSPALIKLCQHNYWEQKPIKNPGLDAASRLIRRPITQHASLHGLGGGRGAAGRWENEGEVGERGGERGCYSRAQQQQQLLFHTLFILQKEEVWMVNLCFWV